MERERAQLVISLGEGAEGQRLREVLDRAAERAGRPVSVWAKETLFAAAGDSTSRGSVDPIVEVRIDGSKMTLIDLRSIGAVQSGWSHQFNALIGGDWVLLGVSNPDEVIERWKRVRRWGLM